MFKSSTRRFGTTIYNATSHTVLPFGADIAFICVTSCHSPYKTTLYETRTNSSSGIATNNTLMSAFESSSNVIPYYLQGHLAAGIEHTTVFEIAQNIRVLSWPFDISYPAAKLNNLCESTPNILGLDGIREVIKHTNNILSGLYSKKYNTNSLPDIVTNEELMPAFKSSPSKNPYYLQEPSAASVAPTTVCETNPDAGGLSMPFGSSYPGSNVVCKSMPNILGFEGQVPEVIEYPNIFPSGLSSKQYKSNLLPGIITRKALMPAFESSPNMNPYYLQGNLAANIKPTTVLGTNPNVDGISRPYGLSYPKAGLNVVCKTTPNILGSEGLVPEMIKHPISFPSGLSSKQYKSNSLPGIVTNEELMPAFESSPNMNPYYLQGNLAANINPTTVLGTNPNVKGFSCPYGLSYPKSGSNVVCETTPNILGSEGLVPEMIKHPIIFPPGLSSKQYKSNLLPGIVLNEELMPAFGSSPNMNPYYLQGNLAANINPTTFLGTDPNVDGFSMPFGSSYPGSNVMCKSTPNILRLEALVPKVIKHPKILPLRLSSKQNKSNLLPGIITRKALMPAFGSSPNKNPYYLQEISAANITPTTVLATNPNEDGFRIPYSLTYPEAGLNVVCKSMPNILGFEGQVPEVIEHPNIFPSELSSKQYKSNSLPVISTNEELMPAFESSPNMNPYYLQGNLAANIKTTTVLGTNPNVDGFSWPYGLSYPKAGSNDVCKTTPNILGSEGLVPEMIKHPIIFSSGLSSKQYKSNSLPGKVTNEELMPAFESSPNMNPYYLQGNLAANINPTTVLETNPNVDGFSWPYGLSYPKAGSNVVCETTPNILGSEGLVREMIKHPIIFPPGLFSKQYKSNSLPGIVINEELMPALESSPSKNSYYLQGPSAASVAPTTVCETNPNAGGFSMPFGSSYPGSNAMCKSTPNILGLERLVPKVIKHPKILPLGLSSKQNKSKLLPGIITRKALMPAFESSPNKDPYYLQGLAAAGIVPTTARETNPNADRYSIPFVSSYPEAESNIVCESTPNILGFEGLGPEMIKHPNIFPSGLYSKKYKSNSLPGIVLNEELMPAFESSPNMDPYNLQGNLAANINPTIFLGTNPNVDGFSMPFGSSYPGSNDMCKSTPNILRLEGLVPKVIKHPKILPLGLSTKQNKSNLLPGIITRKALMPAFESSPNKNPYYLQEISAANITPTTVLATNPNLDGFRMPYSLTYPEAGSNVVCKSMPNILGFEGQVPEVIEHPNIFPSGLSSKQYNSNSLPGMVTNDQLIPAFESSPNMNPYYLQGNLAANIKPTTVLGTNPNIDGFSWPFGLSYPKAGSNVVCKTTPNILGSEGLVPEMIKHPIICPSGLSSKQYKSNSLPGIVTNKELMPAFESLPSKNPYYLQWPSATVVTPTTVCETNPNAGGFGMPYGLSFPKAGSNVMCKSTPNILGLEGLVPKMIKHPKILPVGLSSKQYKSNLLPGIITRKALMPAFESSPNKNPYYLQEISAANIKPTTVLGTNPNIDGFSWPFGLSYPKAGSNVVCETTPNILGSEGLVPEMIKHPIIFPSGLSSKQYKSNSLPGIVINEDLMPAFESSPSKNSYYLQGPSAASVAPKTVCETYPNADRFSMPFGSSYPGSNVMCVSTPNILGLEGLVPKVIKHPKILPLGLSSKQIKSILLPGIITSKALMPAFDSSPNKNPYYQQEISAANITPTTVLASNPNVDGFRMPYCLIYPEARSNFVCKSTPDILGFEGQVPEVIEHPNIFPLGLSSKQNKSKLLPGIITRKALMPAFESSPNKDPYYLQGLVAAGIVPTTACETNPNADGYSISFGLSYPEAE
ncbi:unnamed protein product [Parnassius mnemosyne]|uniref:Uncharacterized protein n=1 Tax=Parnassius mnemosyne TaxID=213953 RepID=A0AAV1LW09_9NEOP